MTVLGRDTSSDGFEITIYDYGGMKEPKSFLTMRITNFKITEDWTIYIPNSLNYEAVAKEIVDVLKFELKKTLKTIGKKTSVTSVNINGQIFEVKRRSVNFAIR